MNDSSTQRHGRFNIPAIAASLPEHADTLLVDHYMTDLPSASSRVFRVYRGTPAHFHRHSDEYLYVLSGRGTFWMESADTIAEFGPGDFLFFAKTTVHALPDIIEGPVIFLSVDSPRRIPDDIIFVNPADGSPEQFIQQNNAK